MAEQAVAFHQVARKVGLRQLGHALAGLDGAEAGQPVRHLDQRHAHQPRAALLDAAGEAHHGAERAEIARDVVERLDRQVARLGERALRGREAGDVLHDRIEAAPVGPRARMAIGADADADDAGPELGHALGREAARGHRARAIALGEDVGLAQQARHALDAGRLGEIDPGAALAVAGVHQDLGLVGQVRGSDMQDIGAVLGQHAAAGRPRQHACEIEGAHAARADGRLLKRQWPRRRLADLDDVDQRQLGDGDAVRMGVPFLAAAHQPADAAAVGDRLLDGEPVPLGDSLGQRLARLGLGAGDAQGAGAMMRMVGVQEHDAPVARRVVPGQRIPRHRLLAVLQHVGVGAQRRRRGMTIDRHALRLAGPEPPQVGDREADRAQRRRARRRDAPRCEEHRILAAGDGERIVAAFGAAKLGKDRVGEVRAHVSAMILVSVAIRSCGQVMCGLWLASIS